MFDEKADAPTEGMRWIWLLHPRGRNKLVAVLQAYIDDSGTHDSSDVCVAAGYIASARNWHLFDMRWQRALPSGSVFHAEEWLGRDDAALAVEPLLRAIEMSDIHPIAAAVDVRDFWKYTEDERRYLTGAHWGGNRLKWTVVAGSPNRPFYVPFTWVVGESLGHVKNPNAQAHFVFDRQQVLYGYMRELYSKWKTHDGPAAIGDDFVRKMGDISEGSRIDHPSLQAADLLAYVTYHLARHRWRDAPLPDGVAHCINRIGRFRYKTTVTTLNKQRLDQWLAELPTQVRDGSIVKRA